MDILKDRIKGSIYGVAVGDAFGGPLEFMSEKQIAEKYGRITSMIGGGWLHLRPGETTDDTAMTLAVAEGIVESPDDPCEAIGRRFIDWIESGPKDVGAMCAQSIRMAQRKAKQQGLEAPDFMCWQYASKTTAEFNERHSGNGALMRAVYPALYYPDKQRAVQETMNQGRMTHWDAASDEACKLYASVIHLLIARTAAGAEDIGEQFVNLYSMLQGTRYDLERIQKKTDLQGVNPTGYVVHSMECALYALWDSGCFVDAIINAANTGGDADTIAAICGGVAGAVYGFESIPEEWTHALSEADRMRLDAVSEAAVRNWR